MAKRDVCIECRKEKAIHARKMCAACCSKEWRKRNKQRSLDYAAEYRSKNKDKIEKYRNRPSVKASAKKYREDNKEKNIAYQKIYQTETEDRRLYRAVCVYGEQCQICGESNITVLQWHHREKQADNREYFHTLISRINKAGEPLRDVMLLCANCHILQDIEDGTNQRGERMMRINHMANHIGDEK